MENSSFGRGSDSATVGARLEVAEVIKGWRIDWKCEKWSEEICQFVRERLGLPDNSPIGSVVLREFATPDEIAFVPGNLLLNEGIQAMEDLLIGAGGTAFNNANSRLGVGDSNTAEAASQTDLQAAANKTYKAMNATYPSRASQTLTFQSDFLTGDANYAWAEWVIDNGAGAAKTLNRKVASLGTKATGTWTLTGTVAIS